MKTRAGECLKRAGNKALERDRKRQEGNQDRPAEQLPEQGARRLGEPMGNLNFKGGFSGKGTIS